MGPAMAPAGVATVLTGYSDCSKGTRSNCNGMCCVGSGLAWSCCAFSLGQRGSGGGCEFGVQ